MKYSGIFHKNTNEALAAEGFTDIDLDTLCVVLERDTLGIRECKVSSTNLILKLLIFSNFDGRYLG